MASTSPFTFMSVYSFFVFFNCFMWDENKINLNLKSWVLPQISLGLLWYSCGYISGHDELIHVKFGVWGAGGFSPSSETWRTWSTRYHKYWCHKERRAADVSHRLIKVIKVSYIIKCMVNFEVCVSIYDTAFCLNIFWE